MRTLADNGDKRAARVLRVTGNPGKMLSAILIGNNIVNLSASSISTSLAIHLFGNTGAGIATGILTFLILIFGEVTPKTMATIKADSMSLTAAAPIGFLMKILTPVIFIINKLSLGLMFLLHVNIKDAQKKMTEEELRTIVDVSQENGVIACTFRGISFFEAVKDGNIEAVSKNLKEEAFTNPEGMGILSKNPLTNLKYHFVITVALVTRYCIDGGMETEQAYRQCNTV